MAFVYAIKSGELAAAKETSIESVITYVKLS